jgi:hypothetical protein
METTTTSPCPWCREFAGYRNQTLCEVLTRAPITLAGCAASGVYLALRYPKDFHNLLSALSTPTCDLRCNHCSRLVRVCPNCDNTSRWINPLGVKCADCQTMFM